MVVLYLILLTGWLVVVGVVRSAVHQRTTGVPSHTASLRSAARHAAVCGRASARTTEPALLVAELPARRPSRLRRIAAPQPSRTFPIQDRSRQPPSRHHVARPPRRPNRQFFTARARGRGSSHKTRDGLTPLGNRDHDPGAAQPRTRTAPHTVKTRYACDRLAPVPGRQSNGVKRRWCGGGGRRGWRGRRVRGCGRGGRDGSG